MNSTERVRNAILGKPVDRTPIYGWVYANLEQQLTEAYGSVAAFEDHYEFDMAHLFGGAKTFDWDFIEKLQQENEELTPDILLENDYMLDPDDESGYEDLKKDLAFHKERDRFCYVQTPGFFEKYNGVFGIQNHLCDLMLYEDELAEIYRRQADWTIKFADNCIDLGVDMIHISDDWGSQNNLMFSPEIWDRLIYPNFKKVVDHVHSRGCLCSLHSDGCISAVCDRLAEIGINMVHPWQETAGMSYDTYLEKYSDKFAILGGVCVQSTLGFGNYERLESEIRRVFSLLKGKRWICCTTHFVQDHCSLEELKFAFDLIYKLARE